MTDRKYKVVIAQSGKQDVKEKKKYIIQHFKYREYDIYIEPIENHLLFFIVNEYKSTVTVLRVLQDGMDWQYIIKKWLKENS